MPPRRLQIAADGAIRRIDAGMLDGALFVNVAGIGFDARIASRLAAPGARRGLLGYVIATMGELRTLQAWPYWIRDARSMSMVVHTCRTSSIIPRVVHCAGRTHDSPVTARRLRRRRCSMTA